VPEESAPFEAAKEDLKDEVVVDEEPTKALEELTIADAVTEDQPNVTEDASIDVAKEEAPAKVDEGISLEEVKALVEETGVLAEETPAVAEEVKQPIAV